MSDSGQTDNMDDEVIAFTRIRRLVAQRMVQSKATSPHTLMAMELDYEHVEQVRRDLGARFKDEEGFGLSYLPFAACATAQALVEFTHLNASIGENSLIVHRAINLGIAVDLDKGGLVVAVVHNAPALGLREMARQIRDLAGRARAGKLGMEDITGGTFTITNTGPFGTMLTGAIINQPEVAILATDAVTRKPVVVAADDGGESITIHSVGVASINFDHRAVDGALVARFLGRLGRILNERKWADELSSEN